MVSLEGGIYVVQACLDSGRQPIRDAQGQVLHLRSTTEVRERLAECAALPCELIQQCAHDEMCGPRSAAVAPLRVPLSLEQRW